MADEPVVYLKDVSFSYGGAAVLEEVSFAVASGESVCIVGPNGGGKTTLAKLILGLLKPQRGEVRVFGQTPQRARLRIGYMPQHARYDPQFPLTVSDLVLMGRLGGPGVSGFLGWYTAADRRIVRDALGQVGMGDFAHRPFATLSGGQRQRVLIARAICCRPDLLLLDEPTANVDTLAEGRLVEILRELNRRMTILTVSHDLGFVSGLVEKVVCVNRRVVVHPTSELTGEAIRDIYGGDVRMVCHDDVVSHGGQADD